MWLVTWIVTFVRVVAVPVAVAVGICHRACIRALSIRITGVHAAPLVGIRRHGLWFPFRWDRRGADRARELQV